MFTTTSTPEMIIGKRYLLQQVLGQGGMGIVYRATDRLTGQSIALKRVTTSTDDLIFGSQDSSGNVRLALAHEFQLLATLHHPNIITVLDYGFDAEHQPFFTMEMLEKSESIIEAGNGLSMENKIGLIVQMLQALAYLHRRGILHRDLKPRNVLTREGTVKVLDFGLSTMRNQHEELGGTTVGTIAYMAPEIWNGGPPSEAADLYAVGTIAYELLVGQHPFEVDNLTRLIENVLNTVVTVPENIDRPVAAIVERLLAKSPADRYSNAAEVIEALEKATNHPLSEETSAIRESYLQAARLVGRDAELKQLSTLLEATMGGQSSALLLSGESGVGKSRLLDEIRTLALVKGALVLRGQAVSEAGTLYQEWREALRWVCLQTDMDDLEAGVLKVLLPDINILLEREIPDAPTLDPQSTQTRLLDVIESLFRRLSQPTVLILEDLHWASSESLGLLTRLLGIVQNTPLLILGSFRDDERADLPQTLGIGTLKLGRLSATGIRELTESMLGEAGRQPQVVDLLGRETEGNVFFLVEVVRSLAAEAGQLNKIGSMTLPKQVFSGGVRQVVQRRLGRIPEKDLVLLRAAAVFGRKLDLDILRTIDPDRDQSKWLTDCNDATVLETHEGTWRFAHDKLRDGVLTDLSADDRKAIHRQIAMAIETVHPGQQAEALGHHYLQAEVWDKAYDNLTQAGDAARQLFAYPEARTHYAQALESLSHLPENNVNAGRSVDTIIKQVDVTWVADSPPVQLERLTRAEALAQQLPGADGAAGGDRLRLARIHYWMGRFHYLRNEMREAVGFYRQVLEVGQEFGDEELIAIPGAVLGRLLGVQGRFGQSEPLLRQVIGPLEKSGNWADWVWAVGFLGLSMAGRGQYFEGIAECKRANVRAVETKYLTAVGASHALWAGAHLHGGSGNAIHMAEEGRALVEVAEQAGDRLYIYVGHGFAAWGQSRLGQHKEALKSQNSYKEVAQSLGGTGGRLLLADWFAAADAEMALNRGLLDEAITLAEDAVKLAQTAGGIYAEGLAQAIWGKAIAAGGSTGLDEAANHFAESIRIFQTGDIRLEAARTERAWGLLCKQQNDAAGAKEHLQKAIAQFETSNLTQELYATRADLAG